MLDTRGNVLISSGMPKSCGVGGTNSAEVPFIVIPFLSTVTIPYNGFV